MKSRMVALWLDVYVADELPPRRVAELFATAVVDVPHAGRVEQVGVRRAVVDGVDYTFGLRDELRERDVR